MLNKKESNMHRMKYKSGEFSRLVGTGKTEEQAIANLQLKTFQKKKGTC